jgi:hypothetical protein
MEPTFKKFVHKEIAFTLSVQSAKPHFEPPKIYENSLAGAFGGDTLAGPPFGEGVSGEKL